MKRNVLYHSWRLNSFVKNIRFLCTWSHWIWESTSLVVAVMFTQFSILLRNEFGKSSCQLCRVIQDRDVKLLFFTQPRILHRQGAVVFYYHFLNFCIHSINTNLYIYLHNTICSTPFLYHSILKWHESIASWEVTTTSCIYYSGFGVYHKFYAVRRSCEQCVRFHKYFW